MTATPAHLDRFANRAPRGGAVSPVNGRFYAGGTFMPMAPAEFQAAPPARLEGSSAQILWAARLRRQAVARLDEEIAARRLMLNDPRTVDVAGVRRGIRRDEVARWSLVAERSAGAIIAGRGTFA